MRWLLVLSMVAVLQVPPQAGAPTMPYVAQGACPFEGCTYRDWTARTTVVAVSDPESTWMSGTPASSLKVEFSVKPGEIVTAMTGVVLVTTPGRARLTKPKKAQPFIRSFPTLRGTPIDLSPSDAVYLLDYHGEGEWTAWARDHLFSFMEMEDGAVVERPQSAWWVKIRNARGQIGWTNQGRAFGNTDRLGGPEPDYAAFFYDLPHEPWTDLLPGVKIKPIVGETGTFVFAEFEAGKQAPVPAHHHAQEQGNFGLDGTFDISIGGHIRQLRPISGTLTPPNAEHFIVNTGKTVAHLLEFQPIRRLDLLQPRPPATFASAPKPVPIAPAAAPLIDFAGSTKRLAGAQCSYTVIDVGTSAAPLNLRPQPVAAEQFFYVISGDVEVTVGTARQRVRTGELLLVPRRATRVTVSKVVREARLLRFDPAGR